MSLQRPDHRRFDQLKLIWRNKLPSLRIIYEYPNNVLLNVELKYYLIKKYKHSIISIFTSYGLYLKVVQLLK